MALVHPIRSTYEYWAPRKGVKRKREEDDGNTVASLANERQRILDLSKQKLYADNPENPENLLRRRREPCLLRSVLILRTLKVIEDELRGEGLETAVEPAVDNIPEMSTTQMTLDRLRLPDMSTFMYPLSSSPMPMSVELSSLGDSGSYMAGHDTSVVNLMPVSCIRPAAAEDDSVWSNDSYSPADADMLFNLLKAVYPNTFATASPEFAGHAEMSVYSDKSSIEARFSSFEMYGELVSTTYQDGQFPALDTPTSVLGEYTGTIPATLQSVGKGESPGDSNNNLNSQRQSCFINDLTNEMLLELERELNNFVATPSSEMYSSQCFLPQTAVIPSSSSCNTLTTSYSRSSTQDSEGMLVQNALQDMVSAILAPNLANGNTVGPVLNAQCSTYCRNDSSSGIDDLDSIMQVISSFTVAV